MKILDHFRIVQLQVVLWFGYQCQKKREKGETLKPMCMALLKSQYLSTLIANYRNISG